MIMMKTKTVAHCDERGFKPEAKECWTGEESGKECYWLLGVGIKGGREVLKEGS